MDKQMIIMRGISGSGKSTAARKLGGVVCSADEYFMQKGEYVFDKERYGDSHRWCRAKAQEAIIKSAELVIIDNMNLRECDYMPYVEMAEKAGYEVIYQTYLPTDPILHEERNTHGLTLAQIKEQIARYEL